MKFRILLFSLSLTLLWALLFLRYISVLGFPNGAVALFALAYALGHATELALIVSIILFLVHFTPLPKHVFSVFAIALSSVVTAFLLVNYVVYKQFHMHINVSMLDMFFGSASGDIFDFPAVMYVEVAVVAVVIVVVAVFLWRLTDRLTKKIACNKVKYVALALVVFALSYQIVYAVSNFYSYTRITYQMLSLPLVYPLSLNKFLRSAGLKQPVYANFELDVKTMHYPQNPIKLGKSNGLNLVMILLDGWRWDVFTEDVSPNIYELSKRSSQFLNHNSNANHTRHGVFAFIYSIAGMYWNTVLEGHTSPVLLNAMIDNGYQMGVYGSASLASPEFNKTAFVRVKDLDIKTEGGGAEYRDQTITNKFIKFMDERDKSKPFFSFLFYDSTHPYDFDVDIYTPKFEPYYGDKKNYLDLDKDKKTLLFNRYLNSINYVDMLIKRVIDRLKAENLLDNTIIVISSDHGESFDDLGLGEWGHNGNFAECETHVPMLIYLPKTVAKSYQHTTTHMDVAPTLMKYMFNAENEPSDYSAGLDIFSSEPRKYVYMHGADNSYGISIGDGKITVFPGYIGGAYVVDAKTYRRLDEKPSPDVYKYVLEELSRFK
ncbi:DUF3413 domain-containing protein [Deferribacterales bacterium RsTz2092]